MIRADANSLAGQAAHQLAAGDGLAYAEMLENFLQAYPLALLLFVCGVMAILLWVVLWVVHKVSRTSRFNPQLMSPTAADAFLGLLIGIPLTFFTESPMRFRFLAIGVFAAWKLMTERGND